MAINLNDTNKIFAPKPIDDRMGKFVAGVWQPFDSVADANSRITYRHKGLTVPVLRNGEITDYWYKNGTTDNDLIPKNPASFSSFASLSGTTDRYENGTTIHTKGYYTDGDGGAAQYLISSTPLAGISVGSPAQISLPGSKYAILTHQGSVNLEQFGAKGDGTTNDYNAFFYINQYKQVQTNLNTIFGSPGKTYRLVKQARPLGSAAEGSFDDCFIRVNYSGCTWDGRGAKIYWDNNATQSYIYATVGGHTNVYRAKHSNRNTYPLVGTLAENSWWEYHWQVMEQDVTPDGTYLFWDANTQYYGAQNFAAIGYPPSSGQPRVENITFKDWDVSGMETDAVALSSGHWNIFSKGFYIFYNYDNITYERIKLHHIVSEMFYGGAESEAGRQTIKGCTVYMGHNGVSGGGNPFYIQDNTFEDLSANGIENFPFGRKLLIEGNTFRRCGNGCTIGGPGNDLQVTDHVSISNNTFHDTTTYGIYFSGRARGVTVSGNIMYDSGISMYMLSNLGFPMTASEYIISNNQIYSHTRGLNFGIIINSAAAQTIDQTTNIRITDNILGTTAIKEINGWPGQLGTGISFYGSVFKDILVDGNWFVGKIQQYYEYVVKDNNWQPIFGKNYYRANYSDNHIIGIGNGSAWNSPTSFDVNTTRGDNQMILVGGGTPVGNGFPTCFFKAPELHDSAVRLDNIENYIGVTFNTRCVLLPSGNDNLKRAFPFMSILTNMGYIKTGVSLKLIQAPTYLERPEESRMRSWEYQGMTDRMRIPDVVPVVISEYVYGPIAPGETRYYDIYNVWFNLTYDQFVVDVDVLNNVLTTPGIAVTLVQMEYSGNWFLRVSFQNQTASTISMDNKVIAYKIYPISNPTYLPTDIAPLRSEGLSNMIPTGNDIPHRFLFRNTETNEYLEYSQKTKQWSAI